MPRAPDGSNHSGERHPLDSALVASSLQTSDVTEPKRLAGEVLQQFVEVTAPYWEPPPMQLMTVWEGGVGGGSTTKPGNVVLNLGKLVRAIATGILTITGAMAVPWTLVIGALVTWDALWSCLRIEIGEHQACVAWVLWSMRDASAGIQALDG